LARRLLDPGPRFKKDAKRLEPRMKAELGMVFDELLADAPMAPGRQHKKLQGRGEFYSVRLSRQFRLVYERSPEGDILPYAVGAHDDAYRI
jgi:mRNA-degrading endonuclease RelE of RelBE toxin-antitoxin system